MLTRSEFFKETITYLGGFYGIGQLESMGRDDIIKSSLPINMNTNENSFWDEIRNEFNPSPNFINLEHGFYSPMPQKVRDAYVKNIDEVNSNSSRFMRHQWDEIKASLKATIGAHVGWKPSEFLFTRNTTESLNTVIMGIPLKTGDHVLISNQDYPSALVQWTYRAKRDGLNLTILNIDHHDDDMIVGLFESHITNKTKVLHTTHMIHSTGRVLPVKKLCALGRLKNIQTIVDGAHAFNHLDDSISNFAPDYYMCSLHKWTLNPLGSGLLYINPERLANLQPLYGEIYFGDDDIRKMERLGTLDPPVFMTLPTALNFHNMIGAKRKEERLHFLKNYWATKISKLSGIQINTPLERGKSGAIGNFSISGVNNSDIVKELFEKYKIHTNSTDDFPIKGVRVTCQIYTSLSELDILIDAITNISKQK